MKTLIKLIKHKTIKEVKDFFGYGEAINVYINVDALITCFYDDLDQYRTSESTTKFKIFGYALKNTKFISFWVDIEITTEKIIVRRIISV